MIYFIAQDKMDLVKIGHVSKGQENQRLSTLQTGNPEKLQMLTTIQGGRKEERNLHSIFAEYRYRGEWFFHTGKLKAYIASHSPMQHKPSLLDDAAFMAVHRRVTDAVHAQPTQ